jgi:hypothetical protein
MVCVGVFRWCHCCSARWTPLSWSEFFPLDATLVAGFLLLGLLGSRSYEGTAGYGMEYPTSAYRVSRVVSVWWSRGLAGVFRAAQTPVLAV